jgi:hypothetical protein
MPKLTRAKRNEKGEFIDSPGPGRPRAIDERRYVQAFENAVTPEEFELATKAVLKKAMEGDTTAYRLIAEYGIGKPIQRAEIDMRAVRLDISIVDKVEMIYGSDE